MKKLLLPIILLLLGTGAGVGAAIVLKPAPEEEPEHSNDVACLPTEQVDGTEEVAMPIAPAEDVPVEYVALENQFVIPVIANEAVAAMVVVSLSVEIPAGGRDSITSAEPKLRDVFLHTMFDHANIGGFSGNFTSSNNMRVLREELLRKAQTVVGESARDVLIVEIVRQDL